MATAVVPVSPVVTTRPPRFRSVDWPGSGLLLATVAVAVIGLTVPPGTFRLVATLAFVAYVPGAVLVDHLPLAGAPPALRTIVSLGLGISFSTLVAVEMLVLRWWYPAVAFWILTSCVGIALTVRLVLAWRDAQAERPAIPMQRTTPARARTLRLPSARTVAVPLLALVALVCWITALRVIEPTEMGSLGLVSALSPLVLISYPVLVIAVVAELATRRRTWVLTATVAQGVVMVYGLQPFSEPVARLPVAWYHNGFVNYFAENGQALANYDARFSWPGFFGLIAFAARAAGVTDAIGLLDFAPVVLAGLTVLGVRAIAVQVLGDGRAAWLATWVALLANWTEQDYFSPQGATYVLVLAALALVLHSLSSPGLLETRTTAWRTPPVPANTPGDRTAALLGVLLIVAALVPSHQLTPLMLAGLLAVLRLGGRLWTTWLPILIVVMFLAWTVIAAREFWLGQLDLVIGTVGDPAAVKEGVADRVVGDAGRLAVLSTRFVIIALTLLLAAAGLWLLRRRGSAFLPLAAMMAAPFGVTLLQSYGGEILTRCFLFGLPFLAIGAGVALERLLPTSLRGPAPARTWRRTTGATASAVVLGVLALLLVTARGGNDPYSAPSRADVDAQEYVYRTAAVGDSVQAVAPFGPLRFRRLDTLAQSDLMGQCGSTDDLLGCVSRQRPGYLVFSPVHDAYGRMFAGLPAGWMDQLRTDVQIQEGYTVVFAEDGRTVLRRPPGPPPLGSPMTAEGAR